MFKIFLAGGCAVALMVTGSLLILSSKPTMPTITVKTIVDLGPYCDEHGYLDFGSSEEILARSDALKKPEDQFLMIEDGQTLHSILRPLNISEQEIAMLGTALKPYLLPRDLAMGDLYQAVTKAVNPSESLVTQLIIKKLDPNRVPITYRVTRSGPNLTDAEFQVELLIPPVTEERALIELTVKGTLYQTFNELRYGNELMQRLIGIFPWHLRMPEDVADGDKIEIFAVKKYALGEFIGYGKIQSVYYRQAARTHFATFFVSQDQKIQGFFDEHGISLEKEFAYSPVFETTATSSQNARMHPIRKIRIAHNGIDYRGTIGTPFFSIADGEVIEKRYDKNVGNMIRIRHKYGVHSEYFHADSLEKNLDVGSRVKRGQKLGGIGRTGRLCTGPHLHMGLYKMIGERRSYIKLSSLAKIIKPAPNIDAAHRAEFDSHVKQLIAMMRTQQNSMVATNKN